jgi:hypothetical protein
MLPIFGRRLSAIAAAINFNGAKDPVTIALPHLKMDQPQNNPGTIDN